MKSLSKYLFEALIANKVKIDHTLFPKTKEELKSLVKKLYTEWKKNGSKGELDLNIIDTSKIADMSYLFEGVDLTNVNISDWDVSNVYNMNSMFRSAIVNDLDLSKWDTSNVKYMDKMFMTADFTDRNDYLKDWNVSKVEQFANMFEDTQFDGDISNWDVSSAKDMNSMFYGDNNFTCDLSKWNPKNCTDIGSMFAYCQSFDSNLNGWDVSKVKNMNDTFVETPLAEMKGNKLPKWYKE